MKKLFWISIATFSGIYMFIPEPTDFIPVLGWLDEATAFTVLIYALEKLNIKIPNIFKSKSSKNIITID
ncbi:MAG: uncharacterized membrane protein YkvA (DUF1232 family) [Planctomycetota bacterium]|jgi:uncharacterized membrane protein YkvA (DUF1232 family)